jgi:hypothetical protein
MLLVSGIEADLISIALEKTGLWALVCQISYWPMAVYREGRQMTACRLP